MFRFRDVKLSDVGLRFYLGSKIDPVEFYRATNLADFMKNRESVKTMILPIPSPIYKRAIMYLPLVDYESFGEDFGVISDSTGDLGVFLKYLGEDLEEDIRSRSKLIDPIFIYDPKEDLAFLITYTTDIVERASDSPKIKLQPAFSTSG